MNLVIDGLHSAKLIVPLFFFQKEIDWQPKRIIWLRKENVYAVR